MQAWFMHFFQHVGLLMSIQFRDRKVISTTVAAANHDLKLSVPFLGLQHS